MSPLIASKDRVHSHVFILSDRLLHIDEDEILPDLNENQTVLVLSNGPKDTVAYKEFRKKFCGRLTWVEIVETDSRIGSPDEILIPPSTAITASNELILKSNKEWNPIRIFGRECQDPGDMVPLGKYLHNLTKIWLHQSSGTKWPWMMKYAQHVGEWAASMNQSIENDGLVFHESNRRPLITRI